MTNISNQVVSDVIYADMMKEEFSLRSYPDARVGLLDKGEKLIYGSLIQVVDFSDNYYKNDMTFTLVAKTLGGHLGLEYVVVQSNECAYSVERLRTKILYTAILVGIIIIIIAVMLSYIFLRPIKDKMQEIENFIKDTTHELNTPISALMMSTSRAKDKKTYDEKIITNISISTKQLYEIYSSLTFLNFDSSGEKDEDLDFSHVVSDSLAYFNELLEKKNLDLKFEQTSCLLHISPNKAKMLINNLLSNAIKYSPPNKKISIVITENSFLIEDEGIGIAKEKIDTIFKRFTRASNYAGGFGIGLSIIDSIAKEYKYKVSIESEQNKGTKVSLDFRV
jgi:two-component system OmpR family sensor kinase